MFKKLTVFFVTTGFILSITNSLFAIDPTGRARTIDKKTNVVSSEEKTDVVVPKGVVVELPPAPPGPKKVVGVMDFENKAGVAANMDLGNGMAEMLTTSLINSGRFIVVERKAIQDVLTEQDFGSSGRTTDIAAAKFGKILNAQLLIRGAVTEFSESSGGGSQGISVYGVSLGFNQATAHVAVNIRLYDSTTGQVIDSQRCEGLAEAGGMSVSYTDSNFAVGTSGFTATPLGKATQMAIDNAVRFIILKMQNIPWEGRIVTVKDNLVYVNCGANGGMNAGDILTVHKKGEELIDPATGVSLGSETTLVGKIQIVDVEEKFSKAAIISGSGFGRDDILKYVPLEVPSPTIPEEPR